MYFWRIEALKSDIANGAFGDGKSFPYLVVYVGLTSIATESYGYLPSEEASLRTYILSVVFVLTTIFGTIYAYQANGGAAGTHFAAKYFAIGFVMAIRFIVVAIPMFGVLFAYWFYAFSDTEIISTTWFEVALYAAWYIALYLRIAKHMRDTAKA